MAANIRASQVAVDVVEELIYGAHVRVTGLALDVVEELIDPAHILASHVALDVVEELVHTGQHRVSQVSLTVVEELSYTIVAVTSPPFYVDTTFGLTMPAAVGEPMGISNPADFVEPAVFPLIAPISLGKSPTSPWKFHQIEQGPVIQQHLAYPDEHICTLGETILAEDVDGGLGRIAVADSIKFPAPTFRVKIGTEIMLVYATNGNDWFVDRGSDGTAAVPHIANVSVRFVLTAESLGRFETAAGSGVRYAPSSQIPTTIAVGVIYMPTEGGLFQTVKPG